MKKFREWLNTFQKLSPVFRGLTTLPAFKPHSLGRQLALPPLSSREAVAKCPESVPLDFWMSFLDRIWSSPPDMFEAWALSGFCAGGPKVYAPTRDEFDSLGRVEMNVPWSMYRQPFETFTIVIPEGMFSTPISEDVGFPIALVTRIDVAARIVATTIVGDAKTYMSARYTWPADEDVSIEEHIGQLPDLPANSNRRLDEFETTVSDHVTRAAINACLLLTQYGTKRIGYANPEYAEKLLAKLANNKIPPAAREANQKALRSIPEVYGFDQHVRLYDGERSAGSSSDSDRVHRPHWRRGHWANVACGTGRAERRLVFRRPVMVNAHLFAGDVADTRVTITTTK